MGNERSSRTFAEKIAFEKKQAAKYQDQRTDVEYQLGFFFPEHDTEIRLTPVFTSRHLNSLDIIPYESDNRPEKSNEFNPFTEISLGISISIIDTLMEDTYRVTLADFRYHLIEADFQHPSPRSPRDIIEEDYSEESRP